MSSEYPSRKHFEQTVTDRVVEEPWAISMVREGERVLDVGSATSRYLRELRESSRVCALDLRATPPQPGVDVVRGNLIRAPFRPGTFDVITCVSTIEHVGLDVYGQGADRFGDEVAMRHMRRLLRPGGRLLITAPFGKRAVTAWLRVYDRSSFQRLTGGFRPLSMTYHRRDGDRFVSCRAQELRDAAFDFEGMRSGGVVLAELTPSGAVGWLLARLSLKVRRTLTRRGPFWRDPVSGEAARDWLERRHESDGERTR